MSYRFIDLFAGIGGFRTGFENNDCKCVFSSEIDKHAGEMYKLNYSDDVYKDITKINEKDVEDQNIRLERGEFFFENLLDDNVPENNVLFNYLRRMILANQNEHVL